jgi:hypothetical protein
VNDLNNALAERTAWEAHKETSGETETLIDALKMARKALCLAAVNDRGLFSSIDLALRNTNPERCLVLARVFPVGVLSHSLQDNHFGRLLTGPEQACLHFANLLNQHVPRNDSPTL